MSRRLPSLNALKAFEAAARHENFTVAANELCVTQGAVSHQVKALEAELGVKLFIREHQRLELTGAGRSYLETARDALDRLAAGTARLQQRHSAGMLTVSTSPNFAAKWLVHRLGRFADTHPGVDLSISASLQHVDFIREDVDIAIRHGDGRWPGLHVMRLCVEQLVLVCSPNLRQGKNALRRPENLRHHALLHIDDTSTWTRWFEAAGLEGTRPANGPVFNQASMAIDAAVDAQGVALGRTALVAWDLIAGRLVCPFGPALSVPYAYWLVCPKANADLPKIATFCKWLMAEAAEDTLKLKSLIPASRSR